MSTPADTRLAARALLALIVANRRYWFGVSRQVRSQLRHWHARAAAIEDPALRVLALAKLRDEAFNAQAAAVLATLAPRAHRGAAVRAIVALELLFDCLDGLTEQEHDDPLAEGERLFAVFLAAVDPDSDLPTPTRGANSTATNLTFSTPTDSDATTVAANRHADPYLIELAVAARTAIAELPARASIAATARGCAERTAQAQTRMHAAATLGDGVVCGWARAAARTTDLDWREFLAGSAASVLAVHALVIAAADPDTTPADARRIDDAYLSICAVTTLLDAIVDEHADRRRGELGYITLYEDRGLLALTLSDTARAAVRKSSTLPGAGRHLMTLAGAVAYWSSHPDAQEHSVRYVLAPLQRELKLLITPPLLVMRAWRTARSLTSRREPNAGAAC